MVWDLIRGQFVDVIGWTDDTGDTMCWRFERQGNEIKYGAQLTVREGQTAVFVNEGRIAERGTHDELIRRNRLYAALHRKQLLEDELAAS